MAPQNISYIPLEQAARKYGVSKNVLRQRVESGKLEAIETVNGDLLVADHDIDPSLKIKREDFEHLRGQGISISEAARNYKIAHKTFSRWADAGYIFVIERGWKVILDEADVAYCAAVYKAKYDFYDGQMSGVPIFDENGNPFQAKYPEMAAYRRRLRHRQKQAK
jgi:predicted DNA-binding protein (UPF0251 family)